MKHPDPDDYENEELEGESDDYVYLDEDDDARTARGSGTVAVLGIVAAVCAAALLIVIGVTLVAPSLFKQPASDTDDPDALLHDLHLEEEEELKENPILEQTGTEPTTEPRPALATQ